jgi:AcrR family transcriptional regulator
MAVTEERAVARRPGGRSARVRRKVFDATLALLADSGYQSLTIDAVAARAGVNKTTVYRNWPTKASLIRAAAEDRSASLVRTDTTGDPERDLVAMLTSVAANLASPVGQALVIATLNEADDPQVREARAEFWRVRFDAARGVVKAATGVTDDAEADAVIEQLIAPLYLRALVTGTAIDRGFIERTVRGVLAGAGP